MTFSREVHLIQRPNGALKPENFEIVETRLDDIEDGQVLVENIYISIDPSHRPQMDFQQPLGTVIPSRAVGRVIESKNSTLSVGDLVTSQKGYRDFFVSSEKGLEKIVLESDIPLTAYMHAFAATGFAAYVGLHYIAQVISGEQVFVSSAAGSVGSFAAQIAKIHGCYVVGSTGSDEKADWLRNELNLDAVINYKTHPIKHSLKEATPNGIDVYFDNVGGEHLEAAINRMNPLGRIPVCGMISTYNDRNANPIPNLWKIIYPRTMIRGFVAHEQVRVYADFQTKMKSWLRDGSVKYKETIMHGIESAPAALIGLMEGKNIGKMIVQLTE